MFRFPSWAGVLLVAGPLLVATGARAITGPPSTLTPALGDLPRDLDTLPSQLDVDLFAWREFIALNWPADPRTCGPDLGRTVLDSDGPRVWETWLTDAAVFVAKGGRPAPWCHGRAASAVPHEARGLSLHRIEQADGGVLVDRNGQFARYELRLNQDQYNYLLSHGLWNRKGQRNAQIDMPAGPEDLFCQGRPCGPVGSITVKASWKVLGPGDDPSHFYTIRALLPPASSPGGDPVTLGLVGLHIAHKIASQRTWLWATFEHAENLTNSFDPSRVALKSRPTSPRLNTHFQKLLGDSVWRYYLLVGTQWRGVDPPRTIPSSLANTTMETFLEDSSCMRCHAAAATSSGQPADFSYLLRMAR